MTNATVPRTDRTTRAAGIVTRHEVTPVDDMPGLYRVRDTQTGSGMVHIASMHRCDCADARQRGSQCKHQIAVAEEECALLAYAASWDALARPTCPMCGCPIVSQQFYTGGRGYAFYEVCAGDSSHVTKRG